MGRCLVGSLMTYPSTLLLSKYGTPIFTEFSHYWLTYRTLSKTFSSKWCRNKLNIKYLPQSLVFSFVYSTSESGGSDPFNMWFYMQKGALMEKEWRLRMEHCCHLSSWIILWLGISNFPSTQLALLSEEGRARGFHWSGVCDGNITLCSTDSSSLWKCDFKSSSS